MDPDSSNCVDQPFGQSFCIALEAIFRALTCSNGFPPRSRVLRVDSLAKTGRCRFNTVTAPGFARAILAVVAIPRVPAYCCSTWHCRTETKKRVRGKGTYTRLLQSRSTKRLHPVQRLQARAIVARGTPAATDIGWRHKIALLQYVTDPLLANDSVESSLQPQPPVRVTFPRLRIALWLPHECISRGRDHVPEKKKKRKNNGSVQTAANWPRI